MYKHLHLRLSILMFLQYFVWGAWYVTAGTYLIQTLEFSGREIGLIYGSSAVAACCSPFIIGVLADKYFSIEKILFVLQVLGIFLLWGLSEIRVFSIFYPTILIYMLIFLPGFSLCNSICFHHLKNSKTEFPKIRVWGTIAWILAGLLIGFLQIEDQATPFKIACFCTVILSIYTLTLPKTKPGISKSKSYKEIIFSEDLRLLFRENSFKILIFSIAMICIPAAYYYSFVNPFLNEQGVVNAAGKMSLGQITEIFIMLALPWLFRIVKFKTLVFIGLFAWGFRYLLLSIGLIYDSEILYIISISLHGIAYVLAILSAQILLDIKVPDELRSTAQGFFSFLTLGLGAFIGSYIAGETVSIFSNEDGTHAWYYIWMIPGIFGVMVSLFFLRYYKTIMD